MEESTLESTMESELDALFGTSKSAAPAAVAGKDAKSDPGDKTPPAASPAASETTEEDPLLAALDTIEEDKEAKPDEKPAVSEEQQEILKVIPTAQAAVELYNVAQNYQNFTGALEKGKFGDVEAMLSSWNPDVMDGWMEHIYQKFVGGENPEWVDRFIAEKEGRGPDKAVTKLQKELNALKDQLTEKKAVTTQNTEQQRVQASFQEYNRHIDGLFEKINFNKTDRKWVTADLNQRIAADPKILAAVKSGKPAAANALFKAACRDYLNRDKEVVEQTGEKIAAQEKKKLPLGGAGGQDAGTLPDDIKQVPKGQEDSWVDQQLGKLFGKNKK